MSIELSPQTILIGGFAVFSEAAGLYVKEEPETFGWLSDKAYYEDMRQALDRVAGSREYLRSLNPREPHNSPLIEDIYAALEDGPNHSGASFSGLVASYRAALRDWDQFVTSQKRRVITANYKGSQVNPDRLRWFLNDTYHTFGMTEAEGIVKNLSEHKLTFSDGSSPKSWAELKALTNPLMTEFRLSQEASDAEAVQLTFDCRIDVLEWNYNHPSRWFWPGEADPRQSITREEMAAMELLHPGYSEHIRKVCAELTNTGVINRWDVDEANAFQARLVSLGIAKEL